MGILTAFTRPIVGLYRNRKLKTIAKKQQWCHYTATKIQIAQSLLKAKRHTQALQVYLEMCHLELNGPNDVQMTAKQLGKRPKDISKSVWRDLENSTKPFCPTSPTATLSPGSVAAVCEMINNGFVPMVTERSFRNSARRLQRIARLPKPPEKTWPIIYSAMKRYGLPPQ